MANQYEVLGKAPVAEDLKKLSSENVHLTIKGLSAGYGKMEILHNFDLFESLHSSLLGLGRGLDCNLSRQIFCISVRLSFDLLVFIFSIISICLSLFYKVISPFIPFFFKLNSKITLTSFYDLSVWHNMDIIWFNFI